MMIFSALTTILGRGIPSGKDGIYPDGTAIANFFNWFVQASLIVSDVPRRPQYEKGPLRHALLAFFAKCILPLEDLQGMGLMPPPGCDWEDWVCCLGPCKGQSVMRSVNNRFLSLFRWASGIADPNELLLYCKMAQPFRSLDPCLEFPFSMPTILIPIRELLPEIAAKLQSHQPYFEGKANNLFLCPDHFRVLRSDGSTRNTLPRIVPFGVQYINEGIESGNLHFRLKRMKNNPSRSFATVLISKDSIKRATVFMNPVGTVLNRSEWVEEIERRIKAFASSVSKIWYLVAQILHLGGVNLNEEKDKIVTR